MPARRRRNRRTLCGGGGAEGEVDRVNRVGTTARPGRCPSARVTHPAAAEKPEDFSGATRSPAHFSPVQRETNS